MSLQTFCTVHSRSPVVPRSAWVVHRPIHRPAVPYAAAHLLWGFVVKGLVRPCRHLLGAELHERWRAHLCGLCLTLRDEAGQSARVLAGYDALLLSVLVEAQVGRQPTTTAGRCPLRRLQTAEVLLASTAAMQVAAAGSLLAGAAGLRDKLADADLPYGTRAVARVAAGRYETAGRALASRTRLDPTVALEAPARAAAVESRPSTLDELLAPTGAVVAALFAHTAVVSGLPGNVEALTAAGDAYGRLVHLLDAVDDLAQDVAHAKFNPLTATATTQPQAHRLARQLVEQVRAGVEGVIMADPELARLLLGRGLERAVSRSFKANVLAPQLALVGAMAGLTLCGSEGRRNQRSRKRAGRRRCADSDCLDWECLDPCCSMDCCCDCWSC